MRYFAKPTTISHAALCRFWVPPARSGYSSFSSLFNSSPTSSIPDTCSSSYAIAPPVKVSRSEASAPFALSQEDGFLWLRGNLFSNGRGQRWTIRRHESTVAVPMDPQAEAGSREGTSQVGTSDGIPATSPGDMVKEALQDAKQSSDLTVPNYWGITSRTVCREDGTPWPWHSFMPWETYTSNTSIDLKRHHVPDTLVDKIAFRTVKALRWPTDVFFQKRYGCRAMMLETVAAVPGMVGGMLLHLRSLRRFEHSGGWIKALMEEAENERMHLMTFMEIARPRWYERALVVAVQGIFFNAYFLMYLLSPRLAHRITGYLEEEAIFSYTSYLREIDLGHLPNVPAPAIAIDYWQLPKDATIRDVVEVVRADEAHHRDVNHFAADLYEEGKALKEAPAPLGYH